MATLQIALQPEALIRFASVFTNYVNVIKLFVFKANIASQTVIPLIKWLDAMFGRNTHDSAINEDIHKYSSESAGV